jgi:hypothetical protein
MFSWEPLVQNIFPRSRIRTHIFVRIHCSSSLLALKHSVVLSLLHWFVTAIFSRVGSWPQAKNPTWRTRHYTLSGPYPLTRLTWVALPEAYDPASIALLVTGTQNFLSTIRQQSSRRPYPLVSSAPVHKHDLRPISQNIWNLYKSKVI